MKRDTRFPIYLCPGPCGFYGPATEHKYITSESPTTLLKDKNSNNKLQIEFKDLCTGGLLTGPLYPQTGPLLSCGEPMNATHGD